MAQISTKFIQNNAVDDTKIRLPNGHYLRARNAANSGDVGIIAVDNTNTIQFMSTPQISTPVLVSNDTTNKNYVDTAVANMSDKNQSEYFTLSPTDISNGYIDLANPAFPNSI